MFEPLASFVRQERERQKLTQTKLAKLAQVSRGQLVAFEKGENVTLAFLVKIANALNLSDLPVGNLWLRAAPPHFNTLILAAGALLTTSKALAQVARAGEELEAVAGTLEPLAKRARAKSGADSRRRSTKKAAKRKRSR